MNLSQKLTKKLSTYCQKHNAVLTEDNFQQVCKIAFTKEEYAQCFLSDEILKKIDLLAGEGNGLFDEERYERAIEVFNKALKLIPPPKETWETSLWFYSAIGDSYWFLKKFESSLKNWNKCIEITGGKENPFVRFRLAQTLFELKKYNDAYEKFKAYVNLEDTKELFQYENKKYLQFYQEKAIN